MAPGSSRHACAEAVAVTVPSAASVPNHGSPYVSAASVTAPADGEPRKMTWPTPVKVSLTNDGSFGLSCSSTLSLRDVGAVQRPRRRVEAIGARRVQRGARRSAKRGDAKH